MLPLIRQLVDSYSALYPEESFPILLEQISREEDITSRKNFVGHVVADGCIIDPKNKKILLIHHRALGKWLKPGGHIDEGETQPAHAARREILEETGIRGDFVLDENKQPLLLHINSHVIPLNDEKGEPEHWHHAMTFLFLADSSITLPDNQDEGVLGCQWFDIAELSHDEDLRPILNKIELF